MENDSLKFARELRQKQTIAERHLWQHIRNRQLLNLKFRRQYIIDKYIVDFVCLEIKLIIELDGSQHNEQLIYDNKRTQFLNKLGFIVLRYWNNDVLLRSSNVLTDIYQQAEKRIASDRPSP